MAKAVTNAVDAYICRLTDPVPAALVERIVRELAKAAKGRSRVRKA